MSTSCLTARGVRPSPLTFSWSLSRPQGSNATLTGANTATPSFTPDKLGNYVAQLMVNDGALDSAPDTVTISTTNSKPVANAGPDQNNVLTGTLVNLNGNGSSDADNHTLSFVWSFTANPGNATLNGANTATPNFVPNTAGTYVLQLTVGDGFESSDPDTVSIEVINPTPTANGDTFAATEDITLRPRAIIK